MAYLLKAVFERSRWATDSPKKVGNCLQPFLKLIEAEFFIEGMDRSCIILQSFR
jgi:hypothetical protein